LIAWREIAQWPPLAKRQLIIETGSSSANRIAFLDAARGIAALLVVLHHLNVPGTVHALGDFGRAGVLLFFVISGYCIFLALERYREQKLKTFLMRRAFRLYPAYWASIVAAYFLTETGEPNSVFLINITMVQVVFGVPNVIGVYWTLFVEILFYGIVCVLIVLGLSAERRVVLGAFYSFLGLALTAALIRQFAGWALPFAHFLFMATFLLGGLFHLNRRRGGLALSNAALHSGVFLVCVFAISTLVYMDPMVRPAEGTGPDRVLYHFGNYLVALTVFAIAYFLLNTPNRLGTFLGAISYSLYLLHTVVATLAAPHFPYFGAAATLTAKIIIIGLAILAAAGVYFGVEKPLIRIGRRLENSLGRSRV